MIIFLWSKYFDNCINYYFLISSNYALAFKCVAMIIKSKKLTLIKNWLDILLFSINGII